MNREKLIQFLEGLLASKTRITRRKVMADTGCSAYTLKRAIQVRPDLKPVLKKESSKTNTDLINTVRELFPYMEIVPEFHIGKRLRLDIFISDIRVGIEYNGEQHNEIVQFSNDIGIEQLINGKNRDMRKKQMCEEAKISLLIITPESELLTDKDKLRTAILDIASFDKVLEEQDEDTKKEEWKAKKNAQAKEFRKKQYRRQKEWAKQRREAEKAGQ